MKEDSVSYSVSNFINMLVSAFSEDSAAKESENDKLSYYSWTEEQDVLNHIAQVYLQGVMNAAKIGEMKIFDSNADFTEREARESIKKLSEIAK